MFKSSSEPHLVTGLLATLGLLVVSALAFFPLQNAGVLPGGQVAPVKMAWLAYAILVWYLLPGLILCDARISETVRLAFTVLLVSMLIRGVVELYMMYVTANWHPWMGIGHNLLTFLLMLAILVGTFRTMDRLYWSYLAVATSMFIPETGFAWYMLLNASAPDSAVYFVPDDAQHEWIMILTFGCIVALSAYLFFFLRHWLYVQIKR